MPACVCECVCVCAWARAVEKDAKRNTCASARLDANQPTFISTPELHPERRRRPRRQRQRRRRRRYVRVSAHHADFLDKMYVRYECKKTQIRCTGMYECVSVCSRMCFNRTTSCRHGARGDLHNSPCFPRAACRMYIIVYIRWRTGEYTFSICRFSQHTHTRAETDL